MLFIKFTEFSLLSNRAAFSEEKTNIQYCGGGIGKLLALQIPQQTNFVISALGRVELLALQIPFQTNFVISALGRVELLALHIPVGGQKKKS